MREDDATCCHTGVPRVIGNWTADAAHQATWMGTRGEVRSTCASLPWDVKEARLLAVKHNGSQSCEIVKIFYNKFKDNTELILSSVIYPNKFIFMHTFNFNPSVSFYSRPMTPSLFCWSNKLIVQRPEHTKPNLYWLVARLSRGSRYSSCAGGSRSLRQGCWRRLGAYGHIPCGRNSRIQTQSSASPLGPLPYSWNTDDCLEKWESDSERAEHKRAEKSFSDWLTISTLQAGESAFWHGCQTKTFQVELSVAVTFTHQQTLPIHLTDLHTNTWMMKARHCTTCCLE